VGLLGGHGMVEGVCCYGIAGGCGQDVMSVVYKWEWKVGSTLRGASGTGGSRDSSGVAPNPW
jgi:hypothetical protein